MTDQEITNLIVGSLCIVVSSCVYILGEVPLPPIIFGVVVGVLNILVAFV